MSTTAQPGKPDTPPRKTEASGHLSVKPEGTGPRDTLFQFEKQQKRLVGGVGISMAVHAAVIVLLVFVVKFLPAQVYEAILPEQIRKDIIFVAQPGPAGGGGGGNRRPDPPKPAELPKAAPPEPIPVEPVPVVEAPREEPQEIVPVVTPEATTPSAGALSPNPNSDSRGPGTGGGAGPGRGPGIGPGSGGGTGGGPRRIGNGVSSPIPVYQAKPQYTAEAMRAKVQGVAVVDCVVQVDGTMGTCEVTRSLDSAFGLDQEAIKAARQWRFRPGTFEGQPVPVLVTIELTFTLR